MMLTNNILRVLSIQSHVAFGYAGNKAAVFPMQKIGIDVSPIYTVQLSNHTQYDVFKGSFFSADDIENIITGMSENDFLHQHDAVLSGYIGDVKVAKIIANTVKNIKSQNKDALYCCDPVFGDFYDYQDKGSIFATAEHPNMFLEHLLPLADIITPNLFELSVLSNTHITDTNSLENACKKLIKLNNNPKQIIVVTSTSFTKGKTGIAVYHNEELVHVETSKYKVQPKVSGSGDITAAMFLCYILKGFEIEQSITKVISALDGIFKTTSELNTPELALIQAQEFIR